MTEHLPIDHTHPAENGACTWRSIGFRPRPLRVVHNSITPARIISITLLRSDTTSNIIIIIIIIRRIITIITSRHIRWCVLFITTDLILSPMSWVLTKWIDAIHHNNFFLYYSPAGPWVTNYQLVHYCHTLFHCDMHVAGLREVDWIEIWTIWLKIWNRNCTPDVWTIRLEIRPFNRQHHCIA